ncbi:hypothetical protein [Microbulbifer agarilyticus]|uniref:hypothetical protein n=1 Tax=Microbulbifer agarilyticus TaxID=260552 RepID=UPI001CD2604D|nr:hypothetical protein [Microbulbifer agarilyticus]MCA0895122.1 hypothetical protein [Microbulbifer agarilyticus]
MNIELLIRNLESKSLNILDEILDSRDEEAFDSAWVHANDTVSSELKVSDNKSIFLSLSLATRQHEICCYIQEDLELIERAEMCGIESPFLSYLKECYEQGIVPSQWKG